MANIRASLVFATFAVTNLVHGYELSWSGDFDQQVNELLQYEMLSQTELHNMSRAVVDVEAALQTRWPGSKAFLFGSVVTGLAIRSSDVDIYVALPNQTIVPDDGGLVFEAEQVLMKQPAMFKDFVTNPTFRVPIITFIHVPTGRHCDVSFSGRSAVQNSKLVAYYLKLDKRVLNMALLLKLWGRIQRISREMPNYAMPLLVIFYLQQRSLVPPIACLQANNHTHIENHWNTYFDPIIYTSMNNESLYQLLGGFFQYYSKFKFGEYIISPYAGREINRKLFESVDSVPQDFTLYKSIVGNNITSSLESGFVIIQDSFNHNENVGRNITQSLAIKMQSLFTRAAELYDTSSSDTFLRAILDMDERRNVGGIKKISLAHK